MEIGPIKQLNKNVGGTQNFILSIPGVFVQVQTNSQRNPTSHLDPLCATFIPTRFPRDCSTHVPHPSVLSTHMLRNTLPKSGGISGRWISSSPSRVKLLAASPYRRTVFSHGIQDPENQIGSMKEVERQKKLTLEGLSPLPFCVSAKGKTFWGCGLPLSFPSPKTKVEWFRTFQKRPTGMTAWRRTAKPS